MYAASGNLSRTFIVEQLINIAREVDSGVATVARLLQGSEFPEYQVVDKAFRQEVAMSKRNVEAYTSRLLEYIASGRIELVDNKDLVIAAVRLFDELIYDIEDAVYRVVLLRKYDVKEIPELNEKVSSILRTISSMTNELTAIVRLLSRVGGNKEAVRMLERRVNQVLQAESDVDILYREALDALVAGKPDVLQAMLYKDILEKLEAAADAAKSLAENFRVMARAYDSGSPL